MESWLSPFQVIAPQEIATTEGPEYILERFYVQDVSESTAVLSMQEICCGVKVSQSSRDNYICYGAVQWHHNLFVISTKMYLSYIYGAWTTVSQIDLTIFMK